jgi:hypothetical protein
VDFAELAFDRVQILMRKTITGITMAMLSTMAMVLPGGHGHLQQVVGPDGVDDDERPEPEQGQGVAVKGLRVARGST